MKKIYIAFSIFIPLFSFSQNGNEPDPLQGNYNLATSSEILLFWNYRDYGDTVRHRVVDYYGAAGEYFLEPKEVSASSGQTGLGGKKHIEVITADFNGDGLDEVIAAYEDKDSLLNLVVPEINENSLRINGEKVYNLGKILISNSKNFNSRRLVLKKGFFDSDPYPEFALAFWNSESNLEIKIFDVDSVSLNPVEKNSISDEFMDASQNNSGIYDIAAGDFDGDLRDEIILVYYSEEDDNVWNMSVKIYDYEEVNGVYQLIPKVEKEDFYTQDNFFDPYHRINSLLVSAGDFTGNTIDEFVVDFVLYRNDSETYNHLLPAFVTPNLDTITVDYENEERIFQTLGQSFIGIGMISGDINNDGADEIVVDGDGRLRIYSADGNLKLERGAGGNYGSEERSMNRMALADLDASPTDTVWKPEIIVSSTTQYQPDNFNDYVTMNVRVFEPIIDASGDITSLQNRVTARVDSSEGNGRYYWALAAGDFDGGGIRLGTPKYFTATDIVQPLVILNAPPTHFDVFGDTLFDINRSYNNQLSDFYSTYYTEEETNIQVETEVHKGWTVGGSVSGGFKIPVLEVGVELKIEGEYGKNFSKSASETNIYRVNQNITASNDDFIYATIVDYEIWEYPVIADGEIQGYTLVVEPGGLKKSWFPSKSPQANDYLPDHEVGNILSYNQIASPSENNTLKTALRWSTSDEVTLDGSPGFAYNWSLENENQTETTSSNEVHWRVGASADFNIPFKYIPNFELNGDYSQNEISTRRNKVTYKKGLDVSLGPIDLSIGETYYSVTPYAYWANNGALVLDYAVNPRPSDINVPQTWWQEKYSHKPDPALILPWRLDPEKGINIPDDKREQTKELIFNPDNPKPGETVNISARIHNFSLLNTSSPVEVKFYVEDPDNGGELITSTDGKTVFSTDDFIEARGSKIIRFDWEVPQNISTFPRIYAVIDPENKFDEIHSNNNKGWKVLNIESVTGIDDEKEIAVVKSFSLKQNYPNPFNPATTIAFSIPEYSPVSLKVYDILGRETAVLINAEKQAGVYEVDFNASRLSSGIYFYRLTSGSFTEIKKMVLLK